jgi:hypothetical protein
MKTSAGNDRTNKASNTNAGGPMGGSSTGAHEEGPQGKVQDGNDRGKRRSDSADKPAKDVEKAGRKITGPVRQANANGTQGLR